MPKIHASQSWTDSALVILSEEVRRILKHEAGTRTGEDIEQLHQMRVGTRRVRSALRLFEDSLKLPKPARRKSLAPLAEVLGTVRDLDVQIEMLRDQFLKHLPPVEQTNLESLLSYLEEQRSHARTAMVKYLDSNAYHQFKTAIASYLADPKRRDETGESLYHLLPGLFQEQLETLWAHPGWQEPDIETMHALRIAVKRVRYAFEFFLDCYGKGVRSFYAELKRVQEDLGIIHDCDVLLGQLEAPKSQGTTPWHLPFKRLGMLIRQERRNALRRFRRLRTRLLDARTRGSIGVLVSWPGTSEDQELFEAGRLPTGALELERKYRLEAGQRSDIEALLASWHFRSGGVIQQTDHYLEVLSPHQYVRLRREESELGVCYRLVRKDFGPASSRHTEEETVSDLVYRAFLSRFHQLPVPVISKAHVRWSGFYEQVPLTISFDRVEGIGPESGDYCEIEAMVPDEPLLALAEARLEAVCERFALDPTRRQQQSNVGILLNWVARQQLSAPPARL